MAVKEFQVNTGKLVWVKATTNFFEAGKHVLVGDYVQVREGVGNWLQLLDRATIVEDEEVEAAKLAKSAPAKSSKPAA